MIETLSPSAAPAAAAPFSPPRRRRQLPLGMTCRFVASVAAAASAAVILTSLPGGVRGRGGGAAFVVSSNSRFCGGGCHTGRGGRSLFFAVRGLSTGGRHRSFCETDRFHGATSRSTPLNMVFDFFRERSKEGFDQLNTLAQASYKGELKKGLIDVATYTSQTNKAFASGLAKSRARLLQNLESLLTGVSPEEWLEELEDVLLQADLGTSTTEDIIAEVESLRDGSAKVLSRDDLMSILRGKLIEAFDYDVGVSSSSSSAIQFSTDEKIPTVLFIMGAVSVIYSRKDT